MKPRVLFALSPGLLLLASCLPNRRPAECWGPGVDASFGESSFDDYECPQTERDAAFALAMTTGFLLFAED